MDITVEFVGATCNLTYNCLELVSGGLIIFGSNHAVVVYDLEEKKIVKTHVKHEGKINCLRFIKGSDNKWLVTAGTDGQLILWENRCDRAGKETGSKNSNFLLDSIVCHQPSKGPSIIVCDGIVREHQGQTIGYITCLSQVFIGTANITDGTLVIFQELNLEPSVALDIIFHILGDDELSMGLGMDSGEVALYSTVTSESTNSSQTQLTKLCALKKHEDWVRCLALTKLENGDRLLATGGQDTFIAIWRFKTGVDRVSTEDFEFQVVQFQKYKILFDSLIIGHEGWINSLQWNSKGELISCSSDQTIIIWENVSEIWTEKTRLGVLGGQIPGGFCVKFNESFVACSGFQGAIQIWSRQEQNEEWLLDPSVTGHFNSVSDLDYHPDGHYLVTTSQDQTTRVFSPWGDNRWHEISRPQIHGHDIFALKCSGDCIISGAEEKILRAFQPTEVFVRNFEDVSETPLSLRSVSQAATMPALGLSNQSGTGGSDIRNKRLEERLDEDFLRSETLWPEVSKLYGHGYEICAIGASGKDPIIASGCNSSKPQFSTIVLWCTKSWKNLGEFQFHKLNVTDLEFSNNGRRLLSVSRDRTWALWNVLHPVEGQRDNFSLEVLENGGFHTRALSVGTWSQNGSFFVTGARDKKLIIWKSTKPMEMKNYELVHVETFQSPISAATTNEDDVIVIGFDTGLIFIFLYSAEETEETKRFQCLLKLDRSEAHHGIVKKLKFNPCEKYQLASGSGDHSVKIYQLTPLPL